MLAWPVQLSDINYQLRINNESLFVKIQTNAWKTDDYSLTTID